jgi:hypothetical protein
MLDNVHGCWGRGSLGFGYHVGRYGGGVFVVVVVVVVVQILSFLFFFLTRMIFLIACFVGGSRKTKTEGS